MNPVILFAFAAIVAAFALLLVSLFLIVRWFIVRGMWNFSLVLYTAISFLQQTMSLVWVQALYNDPSLIESRSTKEWLVISVISLINVLTGTALTMKAARSSSASTNGHSSPDNLPPAKPWERPPKPQTPPQNETNPIPPAGGTGAADP